MVRYKRGSRAIDIAVGKRMRLQRLQARKTVADLARGLDLTYQSVQKYETGVSRMSASVLFRIAEILGCHPGDFFAGAVDSQPITVDPHPRRVNSLDVRLVEAIAQIKSREFKHAMLTAIETHLEAQNRKK